MKTYRDILKWGDKRETEIDKGTLEVLKKRFGVSDNELKQKHLSGETEVVLQKKNSLKAEQIKELQTIVGEKNVYTDDFSRANFSHGEYYAELLQLRKGIIATPPDAVVAPQSEEEIVRLLAFCNENKIPVVPVGGQSSVTRALETPQGGIALDLTKHLNQLTKINATNQTASIQAGMYGPAFEAKLNEKGFSCGHFPQSFEFSTVGGWVAAKGAGQASTGYGKIEDMVLALKVVTPAGIIETKDYPKTAQGWDIFPLFIGSEGTLGVITEVSMKIRKYRPKNTSHASFVFKNFEDAVNAMREIVQAGFGLPHLFRISDPTETEIAFSTKGFNDTFKDKFLKYINYKQGERVLMFAAAEGTRDYTRFIIKKIRKKAKKYHALHIGASPTKKWLKQRYSSAYMREPLMDLGIMTDTLESAVTWENLIPLWKAVHAYAEKRPKTVLMVHISHVYENGANLYFTFLSPMEKGNEDADYKAFHKGLVDTIHANKGSLSHHHGVGRVLSPWMESELGSEIINAMRAIKKHFDPNGIMNPGGMLGLD